MFDIFRCTVVLAMDLDDVAHDDVSHVVSRRPWEQPCPVPSVATSYCYEEVNYTLTQAVRSLETRAPHVPSKAILEEGIH
jgi:hypothetical protein